MRAKKVFENIKFERGQDPKKAMGIGPANPASIFKRMQEDEWFISQIQSVDDVIDRTNINLVFEWARSKGTAQDLEWTLQNGADGNSMEDIAIRELTWWGKE